MASSVSQSEEIPKWKLAREGLNLLINNKPDEAEALFKKYPDSLEMFAGYSFGVFMDALMGFEEDKLTLAITTLRETERRCSFDSGWIKSMKSRMFGADSSITEVANLERQIILADSQVCLAILLFLQQDFSSYFKGGWILRKSWKLYQHAYNEIKALYVLNVGDLPEEMTAVRKMSEQFQESAADNTEENSDDPAALACFLPPNGKLIDLDKETIKRLMGAVAFGYGLFHLGISLLPPSLIKVSSFFGFNGNRSIGVANLMYARLGMDMRAPLATLALLWYHTIVRPFYAIDGSNLQAGVEASIQLLDETQREYADSALFLFFKGRVSRLKSDIPEALESFQASVANTTHREIRILSLHEVGWCYLIQLEYRSAENTFQILRSTSRWSRCFYAYLEMICAGSWDNLKDRIHVQEMKCFFEHIPKGSQLEVLLTRRYKCFPSTTNAMTTTDTKFWKMFVYELLYLWNALPNCKLQDIKNIIADCAAITDPLVMEPMPGLSKLIEGYCYGLLRDYEEAMLCFKGCLEIRKHRSSNADDAHVSAFAEYELGNLLLKSSETAEEGKALLQHIAFYKDYDFEQRLTMRIHTLLKNN